MLIRSARPRRVRRPRRPRAGRAAALVLSFALGAAALSPGSAAQQWAWPLAPRPAVVGDWVPPAQRWARGHRGVDLEAAPGATVRAPAAGTVSFVGFVVDRPVLTLDHGRGLRSSFEPVESALVAGDRVHRGQVVGVLRGRDHCGPGSCLHWGVRRDGDYVNPLGFVGALDPSVLLPVPGERLRARAQPSSS
ncbi:M23 family metallopeptidase [uncultured Kocuria sp.]|uniref:M23 family metallopeptidase n=1 Tax=uncultured Kocuria sp. TaxID=259305 RepID=UPI0026041C8E|nr:M23 family metallopeptidase [uncultured Kocuria sp.]